MCSERKKNSSRAWRKRKILEGNCSRCGKTRENLNINKCNICSIVCNLDRLKRRQALKLLTLTEYGRGVCVCVCVCSCVNCGITDLRALSLDHINNDGNMERNSIANRKNNLTSDSLYSSLKKLNFPDKHRYQTLCMNCQFVKANNNNGKLATPQWVPVTEK